MNIFLGSNTPSFVPRLRMSIKAFIGTWKHTKGIVFTIGDTVNIHHRFFIRRK